ncbi:MAG: hypothetical protein WC369_05055 [Dehalococcoidales bacterium]
MRCTCGSDQETSLRCSKCGKPICTRCLVQTPIGARCPECARLYKLPTYSVSTAYYLRAAAVAMVLAVVMGLIWGVVTKMVPLFNLNLLLAPVVGYIIGEVTSRAVNRKRSTGLAVIAAAGVIVSYLINLLLRLSGGLVLSLDLQFILFNLLALALGIYLAVSRLR